MKTKQTPAQRRIAIAKDVLKQIKTNSVKIKRGMFFGAPSGSGARRSFYDSQVNQTAVRDGKLKHCEVCAIGAAMLSSIRLFNKFDEPARDIGEEHAFAVVEQHFSRSQARKIEIAFEMGGGAVGAFKRGEGAAEKFGRQIGNSTERAQAIFTNIVKNGGTFKP